MTRRICATESLDEPGPERPFGVFEHGPAALELPAGVARYEVLEEPAATARVLYARLREADTAGHEVLVACLPRAEGLGVAVRDRLARAAAPRPREG